MCALVKIIAKAHPQPPAATSNEQPQVLQPETTPATCDLQPAITPATCDLRPATSNQQKLVVVMAFFSKMGNILRKSATKRICQHLHSFQPSVFQAVRWMSSSKLFVGGISYNTDEQSLREAFAEYGEVVDARIIMDRETGRSKGFGFITYTSSEEASSAIQALDGQDLHGRRLGVNYATDRRSGFGGGGGYGGGFGGAGAYGAGAGGYGAGGNYGGSGGVGDGFASGGNYSPNYGGDDYGSGGAGENYGARGAGSFGGDTYSTTSAGVGADAGSGFGVSGVGYGSGSSANFGVADGAGAGDNFDSVVIGSGNFASGGNGGSMGSTFGGSDKFSKHESFGTDNTFGDNKKEDSLEGNYRDGYDDDAKRA